MWQGIDASELDYEPILNYGKGWAIFFMAFIIVGSLFMLNMFVGVVISTFEQERDKLEHNSLLTPAQKLWV